MRFKYLIIGALGGLSINAWAESEMNCSFQVDSSESYAFYTLGQGIPSQAGINPDKLALVDKQIKQDITNGFPGAAILIIKNGKVIKQNVYGYKYKYSQNTAKSFNHPQALTCDTMFDLASNTKMYATNYALMHLVYLGKLDIDKPIVDYIPEYTGCDKHGECRQDRLVRDLLTHSAGYMPDPQFFNPATINKYGANLYSQNRELTESLILTKLPFISARGGKPNYSDVDFMLLGILVERISGLRLDEYVTKEIYQPLGLHATIFNPLEHGFTPEACAATEISGNTRGGSVNFPHVRTKPLQCQVHDEKAFYSMAGVSGHAGLFANLHDMAILVQLALQSGRYGNLTFWDKKTTDLFISANQQDDTFGLGWRKSGATHAYKPFGNYVSDLAYGHTGWTGTITLIDPKYDLAIVLLTNKKHSTYAAGKFAGDIFASGQYHQIIDLVYQSFQPQLTLKKQK